MKSKRTALYLVVMFLLFTCELCAQMPNFFEKLAVPSVQVEPSVSATSLTKPVASESRLLQPYKVPVYDPAMDNHLVAPPVEEHLGVFGQPIGKVESLLLANGARRHSYAFGKYSRMTLSVYMVTIYFDRDRLVGAFSVEPMPPYKTVESDARKFFFDLFLKGADLSHFQANIANAKLEVKYAP